MPADDYEKISVMKTMKTKAKLERLGKVMAKELNRPRVPMYEVVDIITNEAITARKEAKAQAKGANDG